MFFFFGRKKAAPTRFEVAVPNPEELSMAEMLQMMANMQDGLKHGLRAMAAISRVEVPPSHSQQVIQELTEQVEQFKEGLHQMAAERDRYRQEASDYRKQVDQIRSRANFTKPRKASPDESLGDRLRRSGLR